MRGRSFFLDPDIVLMALLGVFAGAFLIEARSYNPTAALFPRLVSIFSLVFVVWTITQRYLALRRKAKSSPDTKAQAGKKAEGSLAWYWSLATMVGYFVLIYLLGFTLVTLVYLLVLPVLLGYRRYKIVLITGVLSTATFISVFSYVLHARIPEGIVESFFRQFLRAL
ncbi:MAG: tripartite tricarboxylate transporter TctB family protein [Betaproteobacteria bacterium]|nr:tripartite tricarboxylate transporter TctB family protein [Betaproteobacteria bacterium]